MAYWESQRVDRTSMADLAQLISSFQQMGTQAESRENNKQFNQKAF